MDVIKHFIQKAAEYTFFSKAHGTFSGSTILGHKSKPCKFKKTELILSIFSDRKPVRLEINIRKIKNSKPQTHGAKQYVTKQPAWITEEIKRGNQNTHRQMTMKTSL